MSITDRSAMTPHIAYTERPYVGSVPYLRFPVRREPMTDALAAKSLAASAQDERVVPE